MSPIVFKLLLFTEFVEVHVLIWQKSMVMKRTSFCWRMSFQILLFGLWAHLITAVWQRWSLIRGLVNQCKIPVCFLNHVHFIFMCFYRIVVCKNNPHLSAVYSNKHKYSVLKAHNRLNTKPGISWPTISSLSKAKWCGLPLPNKQGEKSRQENCYELRKIEYNLLK